MTKIFVFYWFGDPYEKNANFRDFEGRFAAQSWINQEIQSHPPGYIEIVAIVEGRKLDTQVVEVIQKIEIIDQKS